VGLPHRAGKENDFERGGAGKRREVEEKGSGAEQRTGEMKGSNREQRHRLYFCHEHMDDENTHGCMMTRVTITP